MMEQKKSEANSVQNDLFLYKLLFYKDAKIKKYEKQITKLKKQIKARNERDERCLNDLLLSIEKKDELISSLRTDLNAVKADRDVAARANRSLLKEALESEEKIKDLTKNLNSLRGSNVRFYTIEIEGASIVITGEVVYGEEKSDFCAKGTIDSSDDLELWECEYDF